MKSELVSLAWISTFTALMWVPYVLNRIAAGGLAATVGYPADPVPLAPWAQRLRAAHLNAVENLVVFAALLIAAELLGLGGPALAFAGTLYFWSRMLHAIVYTAGISWVRTLAFAGGFAAQMIVAWQLLAR
jgi:uncharacterized MAPEG superfamily protein